MAEMGASISLDGWQSIRIVGYLHFVPENPEDGKMYLLVLAHPGFFLGGAFSDLCPMGRGTLSSYLTFPTKPFGSTHASSQNSIQIYAIVLLHIRHGQYCAHVT